MSANKVIVTSAVGFQPALTNAATNDTTLISLENPNNEIFSITAPLTIPQDFTGNASRILTIEGNGMTLKPASNFGTDIPLLKRNNGALDIKTCSVIIRNLVIDCNNYPMTALEIFNSSNVIIENCRFINCKTGLNMANVSRGVIKDCKVYNPTAFGFKDGVSTTISTGCNDITYTNCEIISMVTGVSSIVGFDSYATSGIAYYECSTQGRFGKNLKFDSAGGNAGVMFVNSPNTINNLQIRNFKSQMADNAMIYLYLADGFAKIDGLYITSTGVPVGGGMVIIEANAYVLNNTVNPHLYVENVPYLPAGGIFKTTGGIPSPVACPVTPPNDVVTWEFKEIYDGPNIFGAGRWYNSLIPYYRYAEFFSESKKILTDSISINNKFI